MASPANVLLRPRAAVALPWQVVSAVAVAARNYASDNMRLGQKMEQTIAAYERAIARAGTDRFVRPLSLSASASLSARPASFH